MSARRRLDSITDGLLPKAAVLLWLSEAHAFGSLDDYGTWLADRPVAEAPLPRLRSQILGWVRRNLRGRHPQDVVHAEGQTLEDAAFLFALVLTVEGAAREALEVGGLRYGMLYWQRRAITAEERGWGRLTIAGETGEPVSRD